MGFKVKVIRNWWVRAACVCCHGTKGPLLTAFFLLFLFLSPTLTFLQEGVMVGFRNLHGVLSHKQNKIWDISKFIRREHF